jgi:hypothetical protein
MKLEFEQSGRAGVVDVEISRNEDPAAVGCPECARGFPICRATVEPAARGYNDVLGWVQVVDASDLFGEFRNDPFEPIDAEPNHPFCFYGFAPTLLDLPHRDHGEDADFLAHAFLCDLGAEPLLPPAEARCLVGFSWGFAIRGGEISLTEAARLDRSAWDAQLPYLRRTFPAWAFLPA